MSLGSDTETTASLTAAETLGSYKLISELASGELTSIHRARPEGQADAASAVAAGCAVRRLQHAYAGDREHRALFLAAGRAGLQLHSANLVRVIEVHELPEPFIVSELVEGADLERLLANSPGAGMDPSASASPRRDVARYVVPLLVDALLGLQAVHERRTEVGASAGLVHGAACARHMLAREDGIGRLLDLTHAVGPDLPWSTWRDLRLQPSQMAPEQALAPAHVDARCDVFGVGAVLWQVLTGRPLFAAGRSREAAFESMLRQPILAPSELGAAVGYCFDRICLRALQRTRAERYASAAEMADELRREAERAGFYASREEIGAWVREHAPSCARHPRARVAEGARPAWHDMTPEELGERDPASPRRGAAGVAESPLLPTLWVPSAPTPQARPLQVGWTAAAGASQLEHRGAEPNALALAPAHVPAWPAASAQFNGASGPRVEAREPALEARGHSAGQAYDPCPREPSTDLPLPSLPPLPARSHMLRNGALACGALLALFVLSMDARSGLLLRRSSAAQQQPPRLPVRAGETPAALQQRTRHEQHLRQMTAFAPALRQPPEPALSSTSEAAQSLGVSAEPAAAARAHPVSLRGTMSEEAGARPPTHEPQVQTRARRQLDSLPRNPY